MLTINISKLGENKYLLEILLDNQVVSQREVTTSEPYEIAKKLPEILKLNSSASVVIK